VAGGPPELPRAPYQDEGILGPGGRVFIGLLLAVVVVAGIAIAAFSIDFGELGDGQDGKSATADERTTGQASQESSTEADFPPALSTGGLAHAMAALRKEVGTTPVMLRVLAERDGIELDVQGESQPVGYRWSEGELTKLQFVVVVGPMDAAFAASQVDPASLGRLLSGAKRHDRGRDLEVVNATLERDLIEGNLRWVLNEQAPNGSNLTFKARPSGRAVQQIGGTGAAGTGLPPGTQRQLRDAQKRAECFEDAGNDTDAIIDCANQLSP
jgi:hypothetical protein